MTAREEGPRLLCVIGPSGSGKSTFCAAIAETFRDCGVSVGIANLDPANEQPIYKSDFNATELVKVEEVQRELGFGPNAALLYAIEFVVENSQSLLEYVERSAADLLIFDFPGQIELYTNSQTVPTLLRQLASLGRLLCVQLYDSFFRSLISL